MNFIKDSAAWVLMGIAVLIVGLIATDKGELFDPSPMEQQIVALNAELQTANQKLNTPQQRIIQLPEDGFAWHTIIIYKDRSLTDPMDRQVSAMFSSTPRLMSLKAQTHTWEVDPTDRVNGARYAKSGGNVMPQVWLVRSDGLSCYKATGDNIPKDGERLADEIANSIAECYPRPPRPGPGPDNVPQPVVQPIPNSIPDLRPQSVTTEDGMGQGEMIIVGLLIAASAVAGAINESRKPKS